jgi:hypothetical protein
MSIVTLKRKTATKYGNHSNSKGFSLNNSRRISSKEPIYTPFKGPDPRGHGGGNISLQTIVDPKCCNNYDPFNEPVPTVLSNHALLSKKLRPLNSGFPNNVVQPTTSNDYERLVQSKVADLKHNNVDSGTCDTYQKQVGQMDYATYMSTRLKKNKCLAPPKLTYPPRIQRSIGCITNISYEEYVGQQSC